MGRGLSELQQTILRLAPPNAASRCWKPHFRRLCNDLISEMAISESPCREIRPNGEQSGGCCKTNVDGTPENRGTGLPSPRTNNRSDPFPPILVGVH